MPISNANSEKEEYMDLSVFNLDFELYLQDLQNRLADGLIKAGWEREDTLYFEYLEEDQSLSYIIFGPQLLSYTEGSRWVSRVWFKSYDKKLTEKAEKSIKDIFKPFHDEDYSGNDFWINPLYPDGYWSNHALE